MGTPKNDENDVDIAKDDNDITENDDKMAESEGENDDGVTEENGTGNNTDNENNIVSEDENSRTSMDDGYILKNGEIDDTDDIDQDMPEDSLEGAGQEDSMMSEDQPALEKTDTLESDSLALEEDSNMADTDENSTTANNDESNGGIAAPDITREESFVSCINEEGDQTITNVSNEDPFESFAGDAAETDDNTAISNENEGMEGSQDANDAFQIQSVEKNPEDSNDEEQEPTTLNDDVTANSN